MTEEYRRVPVPDFSRKGSRAPEPPPEDDPDACSCPRLDPADWDRVESDWSDIAFLRATTTAVLGVPVGYHAAREALEARARDLGATVPEDAMLLLGAGKFRRPIMLEVEGVPAGAKGVERPGGIAWSRLVPAPWGEMQTAVDDVKRAAAEQYGRDPDHIWLWYLTCKVCSAARSYETLIVAHFADRP